MDARLNIMTLGVEDTARAIAFYRDALGWSPSSVSTGDLTVFKLTTGTALALYPRGSLARDARLEDQGRSGFTGFTLAQNQADRASVDRVLAQAVEAGATLLKAAEDTDWGGYSGYFADLDGNAWEIAWNPFFPLVDGQLHLPD